MEYKCDLITDEIWERARAGEDLPADIRDHLAACPDCERVAAEVQTIVPVVRAAGCVPPAPDCRSAVMERISARPVWRSAWAYAAASILLVAVIAAGLLTMRSGGKHSTPRMVSEPKPEIEQRAVEPQAPPVREPETREPQPAPIIERPKVLVREQPEVKRSKRIDTAPRHAPVQSVKHTPKPEPAPQQKPEIPAPVIDSYEDEPVAAVAVSWPSADQQPTDSYGYVDSDVTTGEVTTCRVQRSTGSVNIYFVSTSKAPGSRPGKGA